MWRSWMAPGSSDGAWIRPQPGTSFAPEHWTTTRDNSARSHRGGIRGHSGCLLSDWVVRRAYEVPDHIVETFRGHVVTEDAI